MSVVRGSAAIVNWVEAGGGEGAREEDELWESDSGMISSIMSVTLDSEVEPSSYSARSLALSRFRRARL